MYCDLIYSYKPVSCNAYIGDPHFLYIQGKKWAILGISLSVGIMHS